MWLVKCKKAIFNNRLSWTIAATTGKFSHDEIGFTFQPSPMYLQNSLEYAAEATKMCDKCTGYLPYIPLNPTLIQFLMGSF